MSFPGGASAEGVGGAQSPASEVVGGASCIRLLSDPVSQSTRNRRGPLCPAFSSYVRRAGGDQSSLGSGLGGAVAFGRTRLERVFVAGLVVFRVFFFWWPAATVWRHMFWICRRAIVAEEKMRRTRRPLQARCRRPPVVALVVVPTVITAWRGSARSRPLVSRKRRGRYVVVPRRLSFSGASE